MIIFHRVSFYYFFESIRRRQFDGEIGFSECASLRNGMFLESLIEQCLWWRDVGGFVGRG